MVSGQYGPEAVAAVCQRLDRLGVSDVVVVPGGDRIDQLAAIAYGLNGRTLVVDSGLIVAEASLGQLVDDPAVRSGALVSPGFLPVRAGTPGGADPSAGPLPAAEVEVSEEDTLGRPAPGDGPAWIGPQAGAVVAPTGAATTDQPVRIVQKRIASAGSSVHVVSSANATSLGGCESLIEHRASVEGPNPRSPQNLLRMSVGLEHVDDLIEDLRQALSKNGGEKNG